MTDFYLITGFLGTGKTTFLKNFLPLFTGKKIRILVNEFGTVGVDGALLAKEKIGLTEITGGSIFCSCRIDQFESALMKLLEEAPEVILVEASGLSDPTTIRKFLAQQETFSAIHFCGCICLVDAVRFPKVYATARVCKKQISVSDLILLNKVDLASPDQIQKGKQLIAAQRPDVTILETSYGAFLPEWFSLFSQTAAKEKENNIHTADINLHKLTITIPDSFAVYELTKFLEMFAEDTYRIKGFVQLKEGIFFVDCVGNFVKITPYENVVSHLNQITILYGYGLPAKESLKKAIQWYPEKGIKEENEMEEKSMIYGALERVLLCEMPETMRVELQNLLAKPNVSDYELKSAYQKYTKRLVLSKPRNEINWNPTVDNEKCSGCQICFSFCPHDVYTMEDGKATVTHPMQCVILCSNCMPKCPAKAISFPEKHSYIELLRYS